MRAGPWMYTLCCREELMVVFYVAGSIAIASTVLMLTRLQAVHALLYLIVSLLAVAVVFYDLGAPFVAALEVITYAGAIMVLFVFVVMLLNLGEEASCAERALLTPSGWIGPTVLAWLLLAEFVWLLARGGASRTAPAVIDPVQVGVALFGRYMIASELASMLLLGGLVAAYHLGWRKVPKTEVTHASHP
jgi:NADH-quinone oxidoreductase subunit J